MNWLDVTSRVVAGHVFAKKALEVIRRAAAEDPSDAHWLVLAHALLNAEAADEALHVLSRRRTADRDGILAKARALVQLSRWSEAKPLLKRAFREIPSDCEPLKALAVVALREGQWREAQRWVELARQTDALDSEVAVLADEVSRLAPFETGPNQASEARALLAAALVRRKIVFRLHVDGFWLLGADGRPLHCPLPRQHVQVDRPWAERQVDQWLMQVDSKADQVGLKGQ